MRPALNCSPKHDNASVAHELEFSPSSSVTVGVEIELQILDPTTRELAPGAVRLLNACKEEKLSGGLPP